MNSENQSGKRKFEIEETTNKRQKVELQIENFICPITRQIIAKPYLAGDGYIYEGQALIQYIKEARSNLTSPLTREKMSKEIHFLKHYEILIKEFIDENPELKQEQFSPESYTNYFENKIMFMEQLEKKRFDLISEYHHILLSDHTDSNDFFREKHGQTIIEYLCEYHYKIKTEHFIKILENCLDIDVEIERDKYPINYILKTKNTQLIEYILNNKFIDLTRKYENHNDILCELVNYTNELKFIKFVVENKNINIDTSLNEDVENCIDLAFRLNKFHMVEYFLDIYLQNDEHIFHHNILLYCCKIYDYDKLNLILEKILFFLRKNKNVHIHDMTYFKYLPNYYRNIYENEHIETLQEQINLLEEINNIMEILNS